MVRRLRSGATGYATVVVGGRSRYVHRLVLETFVGPCPEGMEACHYDGDRSNNALSNLRWDTRAANAADRIRHGTTRRGERAPGARLTNDLVRFIRCSPQSNLTIARRLGMTRQAIGDVRRRRTWRNVPQQLSFKFAQPKVASQKGAV
jgi:hypothetical protein